MATNAQAKKFILEIAPVIQKTAQQKGYKVCSPVIAQACIESAYGTSSLGYKYHNYFGLKCGKSWKGKSVNLSTKEEYTVGQLTTIKDNFRVYDSLEDGIKGYFDFISTSRYSNLKTAITPKEYLQMIKQDGYATSSTYVNTNMNCIAKWDLTKYDSVSVTSDNNPYIMSQTSLKKGSRGESVKWLQYELNKNGAKLTVDGIFGERTKQAVTEYQKTHKLIQDGIVGAKTLRSLTHE